MNLELNGRNCIVIGASRGIGRAIARGLVEEGANVAICARGEGPLQETAAQLRTNGVTVHASACDVGSRGSWHLSGIVAAGAGRSGCADP